jgi:hypothetical protein
MFPNLQWLVAAMVASILVLSGGFGLFAALRVIHEPLTHLPPSAGPLQTFAENTAPPVVAVPFRSRFPADAKPVVQVGGDLQALRLDRDDDAAEVEPPAPQPEDKAAAEAQPATPPDAEQPLAAADRPSKEGIDDSIAAAPAVAEPMPLEIIPTELTADEPTTTEEVPLLIPDPADVADPPKANTPSAAKTSVAKTSASRANAKAKPSRVAAKHDIKHAAQRVAAKVRRTRRPRVQPAAPAFASPPAFQASSLQGQPFQDRAFQDRAFQDRASQEQAIQSRTAAAKGRRSRTQAGTNAPMGGPFVSPTGVDPY